MCFVPLCLPSTFIAMGICLLKKYKPWYESAALANVGKLLFMYASGAFFSALG
jgi:hypothetical protein